MNELRDWINLIADLTLAVQTFYFLHFFFTNCTSYIIFVATQGIFTQSLMWNPKNCKKTLMVDQVNVNYNIRLGHQ